MTIQLRASRFHPALFWTVVVLTSTAGTTISDFINYTSGLGQATGALILGSGLALVLLVWWRSRQTLNVEKVATLTGEVLFWIAVVFSNSLGTSTGDYLAGRLGLRLRPTALLLTRSNPRARNYRSACRNSLHRGRFPDDRCIDCRTEHLTPT